MTKEEIIKEKIIEILNEFKTKPVKVSFVATKINRKPIKVHKFADEKELEKVANKIFGLFKKENQQR